MTTGLEPILRKLRCQLNDILGARLEAVYLFGSQARGDARADSDIDILIVLREEPNYMELLEETAPAVCGLSLEHDVVISPAFISKERFENERLPFILNVVQDYVRLV